jgi:hypothetical protein
MKKQTGIKLVIASLVVGTSVLLAGCAPTEFGMPKAQFEKLNPQQKQQVIASYNRRQAEQQEFGEAMNLLGSVASVHTHSSHSTYHEHEGAWHCDGGSCSRSGSSSSSGTSVGFGF